MNPLIILTAVFATACAAPAYEAVAPVAIAAPAPVAVPAPYVTEEVVGAPITTIEQAPALVSKELHFGSSQFVSGYNTGILKPAIPDFRIQVPTVLKGTVVENAPIVKIAKELHVVNEPVPVERPYEVPYDVPVVREHIEEVAVPVHVDRPYAVPQPVAVAGEPIVNVRRTAPIVERTHSAIVAAPAIAAHAVAAPAIAY